jgi:phospholipase C
MTDLRLVDTIVYLIVENRSFDHVLGHLSLEDSGKINGLTNPLERDEYKNEYDGKAFYPFVMADMAAGRRPSRA